MGRPEARPLLVAGLFDERVRTCEVDLEEGGFSELHPDEAAQIANAREERILEFRAGRHCARRAMEALGVAPAPVLRAEDRSPVWPAGITGSITHTRTGTHGFCAAAVARTAGLRALGLDVEPDTPLGERLWDRVLSEGELRALRGGGEERLALRAKIVFSAKESTYKCQYVLSGEFLEFHDVRIVLEPDDSAFTAELCRAAGPFERGHPFQGRVRVDGGLVVTAVTLG